MPIQKTTEDELLDTCMYVFREKGYNGTSMQDLANACGLTKGNFYHYYPNKEALMIAVLKRMNSYFNHLFSKLNDNTIDIRQKKALFKQKALELFNETGGCLMGNTALEQTHANPEFRKLLKSFFDQWIDAMKQLYTEDGLTESAATEKATLAVAQLEGSVMMMKVFGEKKHLANALDQVLE